MSPAVEGEARAALNGMVWFLDNNDDDDAASVDVARYGRAMPECKHQHQHLFLNHCNRRCFSVKQGQR